MQDLIQQCAEKLTQAQYVVILTGAGVSQESGIPTFRDPEVGLWEEFDPLMLGSPLGWALQPKKVWNWYYERRLEMEHAQPNPGHLALAELETLVPAVVVITQNIDRLHHKAGSTDIIALHGDMFAYKCDRNCQGDPTSVDLAAITWEPESAPPRCPHCEQGHVRPDVVWFGEYLQREHVERALAEAERCDALIVVGTSGAIALSQKIPMVARRKGAFVVEVNPNISQITPLVTRHLCGPSGEILPQLIAVMRDQRAAAS